MRTKISFVLLTLGFLFAAAPQNASAQQFGVLGGVNWAKISGDDAEDLDRNVGFLAGIFARMQLGEIIAFQPEVQYSQKGAKSEETLSDVAVKLTYVDVPLFLSFGFPNSFHAMVGPNFGFEIGCDIEVDSSTIDFDGECDDRDGDFDDRKSFVAGATVGLGFDLPLGGLNLFIDGRYNIDLESFAEAEDVDLKNQAIQLVGGLRFGGN